MRYAELHCKTNFSFLEGASHADELVQRASELGYSALAVTDRDSLAGVVRAHTSAKDLGLKLLIGAEVHPVDAQPVVLWATDRQSYGRLSRLLTVGRRRAEKGQCRLTLEDIAGHAEGLIAGIVSGQECGPKSKVESPKLDTEYSVLSTQYFADGAIDQIIAQRLLLRAPELLHDGFNDSATLVGLAAACAASDFDQAEVRYLQTARQAASEDVDVLRLLARTLTRQGNFEETALLWPKLQSQQPDAESQQAIADLQAEKNYESADRLLAEAGAAGGENLAVRREREELRLSRAEQQLAIARRRAASDKHPKAQSLVPRLEAELLRQQIEILHLRCERLPGDMHLRLELARKLKQAGNYSGAIQRLEEVRSDAVLAAEVLLELGECWQHLRQFEKALDFYWQAITTSNGNQQPRPMVAALYRVGVLAAAMGKASEAREALTRLVEKDHGYKDARERLDKLPAN